MKYYRPEYFDATKKQKGPIDTTKRDIFGKASVLADPKLKRQMDSEFAYSCAKEVGLADPGRRAADREERAGQGRRRRADSGENEADSRRPLVAPQRERLPQRKYGESGEEDRSRRCSCEKEQYESLQKKLIEKEGRMRSKLYESSPKNKPDPKHGTWKIGGDVRYKVNSFRVK